MVNKSGESKRKSQKKKGLTPIRETAFVMPFLFELIEVLKKVPGGLFGGHGGTRNTIRRYSGDKEHSPGDVSRQPRLQYRSSNGRRSRGSTILAC